ncbi:Hydrolase with alpha/beta fold [Burkholderiales bacterium]|nr:Hydrolase with alpha/beta fold [Burkholderiales bacterium]
MLSVIAGVVAALVALVAVLYWRQGTLLFFPEPLAPDYRFNLPGVAEAPLAVDGAVLSALHLRLPDPKGIVFLLHGNAGNLANWFAGREFEGTDFYRRANFDLFMIDYRGYGKSSGRIRSEAQLHGDVAAAWEQVAPLYQGRRKVIFGRSLGTALAAGLAARVRPDLTVLASAYWSMVELARIYYPLAPRFLMRYRLETFRDIANIDGPVLLLHGDQDELIPVTHSVRLQAVARAAQLVRIAGASHSNLDDFTRYREALSDSLARL